MKYFTSAIIAASGNSTRMGLSVPKQLLILDEKPVLAHTLEAFEKAQVIDEIVVVCREQDKEQIEPIAKAFKKVKAVVCGGETRADSVRNGTQACSENVQFYAIHDGARPLVTVCDITAVVTKAYETKAATLGTYVTDTIKVVNKNEVIQSTPVRDTLRAVQTPQVFECELYRRAIDYTVENKLSVTDDCSMVEALGEKVEIVISNGENIKLTTKEDLVFAQAILDSRKRL